MQELALHPSCPCRSRCPPKLVPFDPHPSNLFCPCTRPNAFWMLLLYILIQIIHEDRVDSALIPATYPWSQASTLKHNPLTPSTYPVLDPLASSPHEVLDDWRSANGVFPFKKNRRDVQVITGLSLTSVEGSYSNPFRGPRLSYT